MAVEGDELPAIEVYDPFLDDANPKAAVSIRDVFAGKKGAEELPNKQPGEIGCRGG